MDRKYFLLRAIQDHTGPRMTLEFTSFHVCLLVVKFGAPRQNRTAITGLQNQCNAIILVGRVRQAFAMIF